MARWNGASKGDDVCRLQALLCRSGFDAKPIDGDFGSGTERAVRSFQASNHLTGDGRVDDGTQKSLGMDKPDPTATPVPVIDQLTVDDVAAMFSRSTPRANIERNLPHVLAALRAADLDDRDIVLMALATIRAETEGSSRSTRASRSSTRTRARTRSTGTTT